MIAGWLIYCVVVSALLAVAASSVDALLTARGRAARWVWVAVIAVSLLMPAGSYVLQSRASPPKHRLEETRIGGLIARYPSYILDAPQQRTSLAQTVPRLRAPELLGGERMVVGIVIACILVAAVRIAFDSYLLFRGRKDWSAHVVDGESVLVSDDLGPAIVGLIEPKIVLPRWTLALDATDRDLMMAHEREHIRTNDGRLTTAALLAVVAMPWNPAVWYALRRLRTAIEVDCDRRVLRGFPDVGRYGHLLVDVAQRATGSSLAVAGFSERAGPLARRIQAMTATAKPRVLVRDVARTALAVVAIAASVAMLPPTPGAKADVASFTKIAVLAKHVGDSIATDESPPVVIAAAHDLPSMFSIEAHQPNVEGTERAGTCAGRLRDDRDGTRLRRDMGVGGVTGIVRRGDTTWTRWRSIGYYGVTPVGRYGVQENQMLRVGCGSYTVVTVAGKAIASPAATTLDTPHDDRARRIAAEVVALLRVKPISVELTSGRLEVVIADTSVVTDSTTRPTGRAIFARARALLGATVMPETTTVAFRRGRDRWVSQYYFKNQQQP
jgi:hypothetical protein